MDRINPATLPLSAGWVLLLGSQSSQRAGGKGSVLPPHVGFLPLGHGLGEAGFLTQGHIPCHVAPHSAIAFTGFWPSTPSGQLVVAFLVFLASSLPPFFSLY